MDRPGPRLAAGGGEGPAGDRAVVQEPVVVGLVGADLAEPAHRGAVELQLVDRLPGADPAQLGRAVGGQGDQRHARLVGLADRRVEVGGGGARGAEHRHRRARRLRGAEGEEGGRALVDDHGHLDRRLAPERQRQRRRARAGGEDRVPQPAARQLLDEGRGEGGVALVGIRMGIDGTLEPVGSSAASSISTPRPGPSGGWSIPSRSSHSTEAIVEAKRRWVARPWARPGSSGRRRLAQRLGDLRRRGDPDRAVERAGEVGGKDLGDLDRRLRPADLGELHPGQLAGADRDRPLGVGAALDALVAGDRDRGRLCHLGRLLQGRDRLLHQLDVELLQLGERPLRGLHVPGAVGVDPDARLRPDRLAHRAHLPDVVAGSRASA